ncbi:SMP-30/gluconolactonase/LRE family protein, partial [Saccharomonospora iraqiensis]|uniref:SMP-30/gluconolactonase/LRE family protein n=1 Tax=Saccharomonospora iraqiensis TaxID=52698 RepID=UPI0004790F62
DTADRGASDDRTGDGGAAGVVTTRALLFFVHGVAADGELLHLTSQYGEVRTHDLARGSTRPRVAGLERPTGVCVHGAGTLVVAETGAGRVLTVDGDDTVTVLASGLGEPVDVAVDRWGRCYVSDAKRGAVLRVDDEAVVPVLEGLTAPQGVTVADDALFVVDAGSAAVHTLCLATGGTGVVAQALPLGRRAGTATPGEPALFAHGMPGVPRRFTGLAAGPDGTLYVAGDGTVLRLARPRASPD